MEPASGAAAHESAHPLIPSSQTAPPRHCVRLLTRPRLGWAGRLGVGLLRRGLGRGAEQPLRAQEAAMPAASASRSAAAWPASGSSPACWRTSACAAPQPARPSPPRRCHAPRPQEARSTRGGSAGPSPSGEGALNGSFSPGSRAGGQAGLPAAAALPLSSVRSGQAAPRRGVAAPRRARRARRSASAARTRLSAEDHVFPSATHEHLF
jgi:hypothetical protein